MELQPLRFINVTDPGRIEECADFVARYPHVNALAAIGNPSRFLHTLRTLELVAELRSLPDHAELSLAHCQFDNSWPVVCTEKDAVKLRALESLPENVWYLEIEAVFPLVADGAMADKLSALLHTHGVMCR